MPTEHSQPQFVLIELTAISNLIAYLLNKICNGNFISSETSYNIAVSIVRYNLDNRCLWLSDIRTYMNVVEIENMLQPLDIAVDLKDYLVRYGCEPFMLIEDAVSDYLDPHVGRLTWMVWSIVEYPHSSIKLINDGDYRILQWAMKQEANRTNFYHMYTADTLRGPQ